MPLTSIELADLGLLLFAKRAQTALETEVDERVALRKALLFLAALNQNNQGTAGKEFSRYVLTSLTALVSHLDHFNQEIWDRRRLAIRANAEGESVVAMSTNACCRSLFADALRTQDNAAMA